MGVENYMKPKRYTVCVDIDGVLRDFSNKLQEVFLREHPEYVKKDIKPITSWNFADIYPKSEEYMHQFTFEDHAKEIYTEAPSIKNALYDFKALKRWCKSQNHRLILLTSQPRTKLQLYTLQWLMKNGFKNKEICVVREDKTIINGDILLDDGVHNLTDWKEAGRTAICMDRAWNREWSGSRVSTIAEFTDLIKQIAYGSVL